MKKWLLGVLLTALSGGVWAKEWMYCNERFGYCLAVPDGVLAHPEADNGDGRHFSVGGVRGAAISVYGSHAPTALDMADAAYLRQQRADYRRRYRVTYEVSKPHRYVVSGHHGNGDIFYHVIEVRNGTMYKLAFDYPASAKTVMDPIIKKMALSFLNSR